MVNIWLISIYIYIWLAAKQARLKNDGVLVALGMITPFPTEWKVIKLFQTTNQL